MHRLFDAAELTVQLLPLSAQEAYTIDGCTGILACLDGYMNIAMEQTEVHLGTRVQPVCTDEPVFWITTGKYPAGVCPGTTQE